MPQRILVAREPSVIAVLHGDPDGVQPASEREKASSEPSG
jgi:hypothetical protein